MRKSFILVLTLVMAACLYSVSFAGISTSPHDVVSWTNASNYARINTGVCSYCHIPHSAKGDRLFPTNYATVGITKTDIGTVAILCAQCHSSLDNDFDYAHVDAADAMIFAAVRLGSTRTTNDAATYDSHPTKFSSAYLTDAALGIPEATDTTVFSSKWPYMEDWKQGERDIECTSCHNPHDWNQTTRRNYLRVSYFDSAALEADSTDNFRNVCSFCHTGRDASGVGLLNTAGTHPVGNIVANPATYAMASGYEGIWLDSLYADTTDTTGLFRFFQQYNDTATFTLSRSGLAVGDRGAHLGPDGQFTCMSCHMPHGAPNSRDGIVDTSYTNLTDGLVAGPLLVKDNDISGFDAVSGFAGSGMLDSLAHWDGESAFAINVGESNLCEWCHGITPKKTDTGNEGDSTVALAKYAHPVNQYPTWTSDNITDAYISNLTGEEQSTVQISLKIRYPVRNDSTTVPWVGYEESGDPNEASHIMGSTRLSDGEFLVCMSCHDPHFAQAGTPILRGPSSVEYCEDCHFTNPLPAGASHPVKRMKAGQNCDLVTEDGGTLPNYANLYLETTNPIDSPLNNEEVICRTCHGGPFQTGVIHGGMSRFILTDFITFGEICVNCHGYDNHTGNPNVYSEPWLDTLRLGRADQKIANPSFWYTEGPSQSFLHNVDSGAVGARVGSHYIGQFTANRPYLSDANYGWLGSSDTTLDHATGGQIENTADVNAWLETTWFAPLSSGARRIWDTVGSAQDDGVGVRQFSIVGYLNDTVTQPVIICLSCHTPHGAASGVAGMGPADDTTEDSQWDGELLLAKNFGSYICYVCHLPDATHPVNWPDTTHTDHKPQGRPGGLDHQWVTRTDTAINLEDTTDPKKVVRDSLEIFDSFKPANYPYGDVICESCHSAHSANSRWGSYILEGDTTLAANESADSAWSTDWLNFDTGKHNKRPVVNHTAHDTTKSVNDRPTCEMCHPQGTE